MNRALHHAILLSLALHGLILFAVSVEHPSVPSEPVPEPLAARLVEPPPPPPVSPSLAPPPASPPAFPSQRVEPKPLPAPKSKAAAKRQVPATAAPPVAAAPAAPVPEALPPTPAPKPSPQAAPAPPAVTRVDPTPTPAPSEEQLVARSQEQYRLQLLAAARRHNRYPRLARENNWEGEVQVSITVAADGSASMRIKDSSGHAVLDRQAMEMFKRAQAAVPVPAALRGKQFSLDLKARYSLQDQVSG